MTKQILFKIRVDGPEPLDDARRDQLAADLEDFLRQSGAEFQDLWRETSDANSSAIGELLVAALPFVEPAIKAFSDLLGTWVGSKRVTVTIETLDGRISVSGVGADRIASELAAAIRQ